MLRNTVSPKLMFFAGTDLEERSLALALLCTNLEGLKCFFPFGWEVFF